jgi:hypothetical protein
MQSQSTQRVSGDLGMLPARSCTALVFRQGCGYRARLEHVLRERGSVPYRLSSARWTASWAVSPPAWA